MLPGAGPCHTLSPIVQETARTFKDRVKVIKIDVDKNQVLANQYKVRSIPTLILFWKGQILWQQAGLMTKRDLVAKINQSLNRSYAYAAFVCSKQLYYLFLSNRNHN